MFSFTLVSGMRTYLQSHIKHADGGRLGSKQPINEAMNVSPKSKDKAEKTYL